MKHFIIVIVLFSLIACKESKLSNIEYADPKPVADRALNFIYIANVDSLKALIHPDNLRMIGEDQIETIARAGKEVIDGSEGNVPKLVKTSSGRDYNLGGQVLITTFQYMFQDTASSPNDTMSTIAISVAKSKVIGITVSR